MALSGRGGEREGAVDLDLDLHGRRVGADLRPGRGIGDDALKAVVAPEADGVEQEVEDDEGADREPGIGRRARGGVAVVNPSRLTFGFTTPPRSRRG
jgi:hypothetical protein